MLTLTFIIRYTAWVFAIDSLSVAVRPRVAGNYCVFSGPDIVAGQRVFMFTFIIPPIS
jgi:hypothetical protein